MTGANIANVLTPKVSGGLNLTRAALAASQISISSCRFPRSLKCSDGAGRSITRRRTPVSKLSPPRKGRAASRAPASISACSARAGFVARSAAMTDYLDKRWLAADVERARRSARFAWRSASESATLDLSRRPIGSVCCKASRRSPESPRLAPLIAAQSGAAGCRRSGASCAIGAQSGGHDARSATKLPSCLRLDAGKISAADLLGDLGLDSLSSFELWHRIEAALVMPVPLARFTEASTSRRYPNLPARLPRR